MMNSSLILEAIENTRFGEFSGEVLTVDQKSITASGPFCNVGDTCRIGSRLAVVVALRQDYIELVPLGDLTGVHIGARVILDETLSRIRVGEGFAGRAIDAAGAPIDGGPTIASSAAAPFVRLSALHKTIFNHRIQTGVSAIDGLIPIAQGQRIGIFAASGVGKTTLVELLSQRIQCDKVVMCLIGERGREVERFWRLLRDDESKAPVTIVAATSDESSARRVQAMNQALALCEYWRERGEHVVLFVDSVTRLAMALRDIGLAAGEPPALRSYTPSVFAALPAIVERCGAVKGKGAITAIFTVLSETEDLDDPMVETMKSLLDGHIVLSRRLAHSGHYPAIDVPASISRVADQILNDDALRTAQVFRRHIAKYDDARAMIESGIYEAGSDVEIDQAIELRPALQRFLTEPEGASLAETDRALAECLRAGGVS